MSFSATMGWIGFDAFCFVAFIVLVMTAPVDESQRDGGDGTWGDNDGQ